MLKKFIYRFFLMKLCDQVLRGLEIREMDFAHKIFHKYKEGDIVPKHRVSEMFTSFKICDEDEIEHFVTETDKCLSDNDGLTFDSYMEILQTPSLLDQWSQSVPLWRLLASAIPRKTGVSSFVMKQYTIH